MSTLIEEVVTTTRVLPRIALIACGSFSPPTPMHFRMFEIARDHLEVQEATHQVVGGIVSPTHDAYGKQGLAPGKHRCAMVKLALQSSPWIRVSEWETQQQQWTRTQEVLQYHQNYMNNFINSPGNMEDANGHLPGWLPAGLRERRERVQLRLLCGADLLESFAVPGLWSSADIENIVANHGLVVITRNGACPEKFIFESDILTKYRHNITLVTNWVSNEVSSTLIRRLLSRGLSVKYLIDELVLEYIKQHGLFNFKFKYITAAAIRPPQNIHFNREFINQVNMSAGSSNEHTPSDNEEDADDDGRADVDDNDDDDNDDVDDDEEENMDETDYSIKNIMTSINLDSRRPTTTTKVFCCGESGENSIASKLLPSNRTRPGPGQAVQVITTEARGNNTQREELRHAKKLKTAAPQQV